MLAHSRVDFKSKTGISVAPVKRFEIRSVLPAIDGLKVRRRVIRPTTPLSKAEIVIPSMSSLGIADRSVRGRGDSGPHHAEVRAVLWYLIRP